MESELTINRNTLESSASLQTIMNQQSDVNNSSNHARAESPSNIISNTTSTQSTFIHSNITASSSSSLHSNNNNNNNGQYNGNKGNNSNEQQNKYRICRDFVRGSCRRLYCKVSKYIF